jgi:hypothetical protein
LDLNPALEQCLPLLAEGAHEPLKKVERLGRDDAVSVGYFRCVDLYGSHFTPRGKS